MEIANNGSKHGHGGVPPFECRQLHPHDTPTPRPSPSVFFFRAGTVPSAASASWLGPTQLHRVVAVRPTVPLTTHQVRLKAMRREALRQRCGLIQG
jgi:hypothetical protein